MGLLQRRAEGAFAPSAVPDIVHEVLGTSGEPLDRSTLELMHERAGYDFSRVRVHTGDKAAESAEAVNAQAYTVGSHVVFGNGRYAPGTADGQKLMAHELTHVQQQGTVSDTAPRDLRVNPADDATEIEANAASESILAPQGAHEAVAGSSHGFVQRLPSDDDSGGLQSPRFKGNPVLEACLANLHTMMTNDDGSVRDHGAAVERVQQALIDLGFELPKYGVDGRYGPETKAAVEAFQRSAGFTGKDVDGKIGPKTMDALDAAFPPRKAAPTAAESRTVTDKVDVKTVEKGEVEGDRTKKPEVKTQPQGNKTVTSDRKNPESEDEPAFSFTAEVDVQNQWQIAGTPGDKPDFCDFGVIQLGGKWNWKGVPIGKKLTLFSEPELDINVVPFACGKIPGITLQDNILKWEIMKDIWELALVGTFGLKDDWLKNWHDKPLTGLVGPELDWHPWGGKKNAWYKDLKFKVNVNSVWEKAPEGKKDLWGVQASGGIGYEF